MLRQASDFTRPQFCGATLPALHSPASPLPTPRFLLPPQPQTLSHPLSAAPGMEARDGGGGEPGCAHCSGAFRTEFQAHPTPFEPSLLNSQASSLCALRPWPRY